MIIVLILFLISGSINAASVHDGPYGSSGSPLDLLAQQAGKCPPLEVSQLNLSEQEVKKILGELAQQRSRERTDQKKKAVTFAVATVGSKWKKKSGKSGAADTVNQRPYRVPRSSRVAALRAIDAMKARRQKEREIQKQLKKLT